MKKLIPLLLVAIFSCKHKEPQLRLKPAAVVQADSLPGYCPYLTKDSKGQSVLSWVRAVSDSNNVFCYALAKNDSTFGSPIVIPVSTNVEPHGENLPKIIFKPSGEIIACWGSSSPGAPNKYAGRVYYSQSFDEGKSWTAAKPLVSDTAGYDQRYYDIALLPDGEAAIIWLDNRKTVQKEGSALYFARTNGRDGFQQERLISQPACQCCRTDLFIDQKGGIHVLYRAILNDSIRDMVHSVSTDGGTTFSAPQLVNKDGWVLKACPHTGPAMAENQNGLHFAWYTGANPRGCWYNQSKDNGASFTIRDSVSGKGSHPQLATVTDGDLMIVWDETYQQNNSSYHRIGLQKRHATGRNEGNGYITPDSVFATYPVITPLHGDTSLVAYLQKRGEKNYVNYTVVGL